MTLQDIDIYSVDLPFIRDNAAKVLAATHIKYIKNAPLHGILFEGGCDTGVVSSAFTRFYVDHTEPMEVLEKFKARGKWCLGELLDGHEFLALFPVERHLM